MGVLQVKTRVTYTDAGREFAADIDAEGHVSVGYIDDARADALSLSVEDLPQAFFQAIADAAMALAHAEDGT